MVVQSGGADRPFAMVPAVLTIAQRLSRLSYQVLRKRHLSKSCQAT